MPFVSVTRLRIRSWRFLPSFALHTRGALKQVRVAPGFLGGSLLSDRRWTFWTLTLWDDAASMRSYMASGAHRAAMPRLMRWCDEASVAHWEADALPGWQEAAARMRAEGRPSKLRQSSPDHAAMCFASPRSFTGAPIAPAEPPSSQPNSVIPAKAGILWR